MKAARRWSAVGAILLSVGPAGCGKRGDPQPPLRTIPAGISDLSIERTGTAVALQFTVPEANADGTKPSVTARVEIFAVSLAADATAPTEAQLIVPANLVTSVAVRLKDDAAAGAPADPRPMPGEVARFVETVPAADPKAATPLVRYYTASATTGRRRGAPAPIVPMRVTTDPAAPDGMKADYSEQTLTVSWQATADQRFVIDETNNSGGTPTRLTAAPLEAAKFEVPVEFGKARCFVVRTVDRATSVSIIGPASPPVCVTPVDRFAPPAPTGLLAVPADGGIDVVWTTSPAPDLAGYVVLRRDDPNGTLQRLTPTPITATTYRDVNVRSGLTYEYAVIAIDKTANESTPSERKSATAR